ncbi:transposase [Sphaerisporangium perillae]|uniref:transposase n=1 Tax=Sphaerisporangium perillae TaxID=2935860 RepID=UPI003558A703
MCSVFKAAVWRMLPKAQLAVDAFHVVQLAIGAWTRYAVVPCARSTSGRDGVRTRRTR